MNERDHPEYWKRIARLAMTAAFREGLNYDDAEDCAVEFEAIVLRSAAAPEDLDAPGAIDQLRQQVWWHVKTCVYKRNKANRDVVYLAQFAEGAASGQAREPVSPTRGPEDLAIHRADLETMQKIISALPRRKRWLLRRVEIDGMRVVDLQGECGRSTGAIYKELHETRRLIRDRWEALQVGSGIDTEIE